MSNSTKPRVDDEDDVDDLDDVLDQFTSTKAPASTLSQPPTSSSSTLNEPTSSQASEQKSSSSNADFEADFAKLFAEEMEALIAPKTGENKDFQSRIQNTMNKLKESDSDPLEALLSQLGGEGEEEMQGVLEAMMGQLMGKDVLYEPLKELSDKANATTITSDDKSRYDAQIICIKQLLEIFESKDYADDDDKIRTKVVNLMSELQNHGSPPEEIMGPLPPGLSMGADGMPNMPDDCVIS
ncbi:Pex19 protein [Suillus spraguei]|nr:Pex19 protein [Suillus spraguei]